MFDIGWQELFVLAVLAIIVIGPKDLPRAIKTITQWIKKARGMARDLQDGIDDMVREADLDDIKQQANKMIGDDMDPTGTIARELDMSDEQRDWSKAVEDLKDATDPNRKPETLAETDNTPAVSDAADMEIDAVEMTPEPAPEAFSEPAPQPAPEPASEPDEAPSSEDKKVEG